MNKTFQSFLDASYRYNYQNGPNVITSEGQALKEGINCIGLMHLLVKRLFNISLPQNLRVLEIYNDNPYFKTVSETDELQMGDVLFLGREQLPDYINLYKPRYDEGKNLINEDEGKNIIGDKHAGYHTVMYTGERDENSTPLVIDIEKAADNVRIWILKELMKNEKYKVLYRIKRIVDN
ncbi:MAG: hypothetical protein WCT77_14765 [Bacteroidota bacterium]|jgi:hypothetical protein